MKKATIITSVKNTDRPWFVMDADGKTLGKVAVLIADTLRGKNKPDFTPHMDCGAYVVVLNSEKIHVSGKKEDMKTYTRHTRYIGKLRAEVLKDVRVKNPTRILEEAVSGMLPRTKLRDAQMKRLRLVIGDKNPYEAQKPTPLSLK